MVTKHMTVAEVRRLAAEAANGWAEDMGAIGGGWSPNAIESKVHSILDTALRNAVLAQVGINTRWGSAEMDWTSPLSDAVKATAVAVAKDVLAALFQGPIGLTEKELVGLRRDARKVYLDKLHSEVANYACVQAAADGARVFAEALGLDEAEVREAMDGEA